MCILTDKQIYVTVAQKEVIEMHRTEIYLTEKQKEILHDLAYVQTKKSKRRVSISELIRTALNWWVEEIGADETELVASNPEMLADIKAAKKEMTEGKFVSEEKVFSSEKIPT